MRGDSKSMIKNGQLQQNL